MKLAYFMIDLLFPLVIGYVLRVKQQLSPGFFDKMISYNILLLYPVLSILSFWVLPLTWNLMWLPVFGGLLCFIPGLIAYLISKNKYDSSLDMGSYILAAMLSNVGTLGGLCAFILYGEAGFAYTQLVGLMQTVVLFLVCYPLAQYYYSQEQGDTQSKISLGTLLWNRNQLPVVGLIIGLMLYCFHVPRPEILGEVFNPLVHLAAWTALIPVGYVTEFSAIKKYYASTFDLVPLKFIITPLLSYVIARVVFTDPIMVNTIVILASTPTAINAVIAAKVHNLNVHIATASFVVTTVLFLLVVFPILFFSLMKW